MRLKLLFFPFILILSLIIGINYIWPEYQNLNAAKQELVAANEKLSAENSKQAAVGNINNQLSQDTQKAKKIKSYLPDNKVEEQIINDINYLSSDSSVLLLDFNFDSTTSGSNAPIAIDTEGASSASSQLQPAADLASLEAARPVSVAVNTIQANIKIVGEYAKIKLFLDALERMPIYNTIKSVQITAPTKVANTEEQQNNNNLNAAIIVEFGYLAPVKSNVAQTDSFQPQLDIQAIDSLSKYISVKNFNSTPATTGGKENPFLP